MSSTYSHFSVDNTMYRIDANVIFSGKLSQQKIAAGVLGLNFLALPIFKFGVSIGFAAKLVMRKVVVSVCRHLLHVAKPVPQLKMGWVYAMRNVPSRASVKNHLTFWNRTSTQQPSGSMGINLPVSTFYSLDLTVPFGIVFTGKTASSHPQPMGGSNPNLGPKPFRECQRKVLRGEIFRGNVRPRNQFHVVDDYVGPERLLASSGRFIYSGKIATESQ